MNTECRHLQVRFVSREEDAEFVECVNCGEIFDAAELRDIAAEEEEADEQVGEE
jgi:Zn ribbon nucleic-acid-binding protein